MSRLLGEPGDPWSLSLAVDALAASARRAGVPGFIWLAGFFYPSLELSRGVVELAVGLVEATTPVDVPFVVGSLTQLRPFEVGIWTDHPGSLSWILTFLASLPLFLLVYRLVMGLAKVCDPAAFEATRGASKTVRLRDVWAAGKGLWGAGFGLWILVKLLLLVAIGALMGPLLLVVHALGLEEFSALLMGLFVPLLLVLLLYGVVLEVMNQLALHSLAHNRRGVASALSHAWRLVRNHPLGAVRAALVDFVLTLVLLLTVPFVAVAGTSLGCVLAAVAVPIIAALIGFVGVARAGYWARAYRGLGGLSADDAVPGLGASA